MSRISLSVDYEMGAYENFISKFKLRNRFRLELLAEFFGTFCLLTIGSSVTSTFFLHPNHNPYLNIVDKNNTIVYRIENAPPLPIKYAIATGYSTGAMIGMYASLGISGGHLNPAASFALATIGKFPWYKVIPYSIAQITGAFFGCFPTYFAFKEAFEKQHSFIKQENNKTLLIGGSPHSTGGVYSTFLQPHASTYQTFIDQVIGTSFLLFACMAIADEKNLNVHIGLQPFLMAWVIRTLAMTYSINSDNSLNPARDFGPRLFMFFMEYGKDSFIYRDKWYWLFGGIVGPMVGAVLGCWLYELVIGVNHCLMDRRIPHYFSDTLETKGVKRKDAISDERLFKATNEAEKKNIRF
ncbi:aquaporin-9-like isoform X2 [Dinothrombium tinctorium]|uniref:Aquaporin-9-like isoform X2 n=1 Tax=Dinothrombium tinctorium TaxID=1965070 RepID=A0A3S3S516_9ACAR|nr:aquaporin-9-like isoform X2 [Dinothrombium tinctorium]RWS09213.1 aquaporin-9-like isoform X2 [Dinothrombium tinctorium]RWS09228.1 aquaporin-9-like isoform X2 [Dinothrombium tinctorium]